jgi:hypothetical protein
MFFDMLISAYKSTSGYIPSKGVRTSSTIHEVRHFLSQQASKLVPFYHLPVPIFSRFVAKIIIFSIDSPVARL